MPKDDDKPGWSSYTDDDPVGVLRTPTAAEIQRWGGAKKVEPLEYPEVEVTPLGDPDKPPPKIPWKVYEERGFPVFRIPEGVELTTVEEARALMNQDHMVRSKGGLAPGTLILVQGLIGWMIATVNHDPVTPGATSGEMWVMLDWREDYRWSAEEEIACWTSFGMANMKALKRLTLFAGDEEPHPDMPTVQVEEMDVPITDPGPPLCASCGHDLDAHGQDGCEVMADIEEARSHGAEPDPCSCTTFEFPPCDFIHENIDQLHGVPEMPIEELPTVCTCGRPLTYADEVAFISFPEPAGS